MTTEIINKRIAELKVSLPEGTAYKDIADIIEGEFGEKLSASAVRGRYRRYVASHGKPSTGRPVVYDEIKEFPSDFTIEVREDELPEDESLIDQLLKNAGLDNGAWQVDRAEVKRYEMPLKAGPDETIVHKAYSVRANVSPVGLGVGAEELLDKIAEIGKASTSVRIPNAPKNEDVLFIPSLYDVHLEKLAVKRGVGEDVLTLTYLECLHDLVHRAENSGGYGHTLFVLGNDFGHIDTIAGTTTRGTSVSSSMTYHEGINLRCSLAVAAVLALRDKSPVTIVSVPGNHEESSAAWLARYVEAYFRHDEHVNVIRADGAPRVYYRWGDTQFMLTHGDGLAPQKVVGVMAAEDRENFAQCGKKEVFSGHYHTYRKLAEHLTDEFGVIIRFMPALSKTDRWHEKHMFVGSRRGAIGMLFDKTYGWINEFPSFVS